MNPQIPSSTYPNHLSIVTGVYPEVHGIINNEFYDTKLNMTFAHTKPEFSNKSDWWLAPPIWNTVQEYGKRSAVCFWPGSEAVIAGMQPNYYRNFTSLIKMSERFNLLLSWLDLPAAERPSLLLSYFERVDQMGHLYGTSGPELDAAIEEYDTAFGYFIAALKERRLFNKLNIVVLSDHGMQNVHQIIRLDQEGLIKEEDFLTAEYGPFTYLRPKNPLLLDALIDTLKKGANGRFRVFKKSDLPPAWHFNHPTRLADIIIACEPHYCIAPSHWQTIPGGTHGYAIDDEAGNLVNDDMRALFMISSPNLSQSILVNKPQNLLSQSEPFPRFFNLNVPPFQNLDVYPLLCSLLDIPPAPNNATTCLIDTLLAKA
jgi:predicted AlkP superfamily pyrophosphatase or phosphodiesterase